MKKFHIALIALFLAVIALPAVLVFAGEDKTFSDNENRMLQTAPELSVNSILSGSFQEKITSYISDQFPARDTWTRLGTGIKKLAGFKDIGGAYLGRDGYYMEKITPDDINDETLRRNLGLIKDFTEKNADVPATMLLVPATGTVMSDKLPAHAQMYDAQKIYETVKNALPGVNVPDLYSAMLNNKDHQLYYRTDHHWTWYGAHTAYKTLLPDGAYKATPELFSDSFLGTTYSKTLDPAARPDKVYISEVSDGVSVTADGKESSVYNMAAANEKDKYKVFFGGNYGQTVITGGCKNGKTLLMIKDSFANSLAPMLTADYETIIMLDMRYFAGSTQQLIEDYSVDEILFVAEMSGFANDRNLIKLGF